jgi:selenocysteine-specific elongation factor
MKLNFILATAGHVDHGKSSLVKALTGTDPDRLPEEKARGITIDLGFAHLQLPAARDGKQVTYNVGLVDVPGHEDFVKNMVAGVGSVDLAMLVVAADDGWMPQTEEHLQILSYLGISHAVVALTKIDLAQNKEASIAAVREKLADSPYAHAPIVATSIVSGRGFDELKSALVATLNETPSPPNIGKPRLPIDRVFTLPGIGVVVTGTLAGGELRRGQAVSLQPSSRRGRARSVHNHNESVEVSGPGSRTALNLSDVNVGEVARGDIVAMENLGGASDTWDVVVERSARASGRGIKDGAVVRVHFASANAEARVLLLEGKNLSSGERKLAELRFDQKVFAFVGDHFIIRDSAEQFTLAGGTILSIDAQRREFRSAEQRKFLEARSQANGDPLVFVESQLQRDGFAERTSVLVQSRFSEAEISQSIEALAKKQKVIVLGKLVADAEWWRGLRDRAIKAIDGAHQRNPDQPGLPLNELRATLNCAPEIYDALLAGLSGNGFVQTGTTIARQAHRLELPPHLKESAGKVRKALSEKPIDPPSVAAIAPDPAAQQALRFLIQTGEALELAKEIVMLADAYRSACDQVRKFLAEKKSATTSELRQLLGSSRRVIIPLLEYLDRQGVTVREGDKRALKR